MWPPDHEVSHGPNQQSCCWRPTYDADADRCVWHTDDTDAKTIAALQEVRPDSEVRAQNEPVSELLDGAVLAGCEIQDSISLSRVAFRNADLTDASLKEADLTDAFLNGANLTDASLWNADLTDASLQSANLTDAFLNGADLTDASLWNADLTDAYLRRANLANADLRGADLSGADLREADLSNADLREADLSGTNLSGTNLTDADFISARLISADLRRADLTGAIFNHANLSKADLRGAVLEGSFLDDAILTDVKTRGSRETQKAAERSIEVYNSIRRIFIFGLGYSIIAIIGVGYLERSGYFSDIGSMGSQLPIIISLFFLLIYGLLAQRFIELQSTAKRVIKVDEDG
jgi:uncharacterized protein YjbI with pentapeptide repeats